MKKLISKLIKNSDDGFLVPPGDINKISEALRQLLESDELRNNFTAKLHDKLKATYDIRGWAERIFDIYGEVINR